MGFAPCEMGRSSFQAQELLRLKVRIGSEDQRGKVFIRWSSLTLQVGIGGLHSKADARSQHVQALCVMLPPASSIQHSGKECGLPLAFDGDCLKEFVTYRDN